MYNYTCIECGREVSVKSKKGNPKRCGECRKRLGYCDYYYEHQKEISDSRKRKTKERLGSIEKKCAMCGKKFSPERTSAQKYCSNKCMRCANQDRLDQECKIEGCDRPVRARGMCSMHWRRWARATGREKNPEWDERRRRNYERRRARKKSNGVVDDFTNLEVFERDNWFCGICGLKVDGTLAWPDPMSASLDHIVPLSRGGSHTLDNVQCAHLVCNTRKNDTVLPTGQGVLDICA